MTKNQIDESQSPSSDRSLEPERQYNAQESRVTERHLAVGPGTWRMIP